MDSSKTLELEILITISQNKNVPICHFQYMFEHKWKIYSPRFDELITDKLLVAAKPLVGLPYYELSSEGKSRIAELIEQRELDIASRVLQLQSEKTAPALTWKTIRARVNAAIHVWKPSEKLAGAEHRSDFASLKSWIRRSKLIPHEA